MSDPFQPFEWALAHGRTLMLGPKGRLMAIVNVTPDSFSDGGRWLDFDAAINHARGLGAQGADMIDVGGESTRPGAARLDPEVERGRVLPVIRELVAQGITVSVDTMHADVAEAALECGVHIVNDVSGGRADPNMAPLLAGARVPWVLMHWRSGDSAQPHAVPSYGDVVADVRAELARREGVSAAWSVTG